MINFHHMPDADSLLMQEIYNTFETVYFCDVFKGNRVMFCCKGIEALSKDELKTKTLALIKKVKMPLMYYVRQLKPSDKRYF